jgi:hypothetical protein
MVMRFATFLLAFSNFLALAQNIPFAGTSWKLNPEKWSVPAPACLALHKGLLRLPRSRCLVDRRPSLQTTGHPPPKHATTA